MKASLHKKPARPLTAADLCDRCPARAAVETVMMQGGSLLWCAHHFAFFEDALNAFGALVLSHLLGELWAGRGVPGLVSTGVLAERRRHGGRRRGAGRLVQAPELAVAATRCR